MLMQNEVAGAWRRLAAVALDFVLLHLALTIVTRDMMLSPVGIWALDFVFAVFYSSIFLGLRGQTPGKMALRLRVIGTGDRMLSYGQTFKRSALKWAPIFSVFVLLSVLMPDELQSQLQQESAVEPIEIDPRAALGSSVVVVVGAVGWLWLVHSARRHPDGQALHDRVAETYVIKMP